MAEREIVCVEVHEVDDAMCVTYVDDEPDRMMATQSVVAGFAQEAGLHPVAAPDGVCRWVRDPDLDEEVPL